MKKIYRVMRHDNPGHFTIVLDVSLNRSLLDMHIGDIPSHPEESKRYLFPIANLLCKLDIDNHINMLMSNS